MQAVSRNVETVTLIACDRGLYLTANELSGVFAGSPEGICRAVAMRLSLPVGTLEVPAGWKRLVAGAGVRASTFFDRRSERTAKFPFKTVR